MGIIKKISILILVLILVSGGLFLMRDYTLKVVKESKIALADDDDEEDEKDDEDEEDEEDEDEGEKKQETKTEVKYVKLSDTVSRTTKTITKYDSDGDGILDEQDPYPTVNENFVVKDDDLNGIDDKYEE